MAIALDIAILIVVAFCIWNGWRKGFIKSLSRLLTFVLALLVALLLSGPIAQLVYNTTIAADVRDTLTVHLSNEAIASVEQQVDAAMDTLPSFVRTLLDNRGLADGQAVVKSLDGSANTVSALAEQIEATIVAPTVLLVLRALAFFILFIVAGLIASLLLRLLDKLFDLPILRSINSTLGFIPGAINGALWALVLASVVQALAAVSSPDSFINPTVLADTTVVQWLVNVNPVGNALQEMLSVTNP